MKKDDFPNKKYDFFSEFPPLFGIVSKSKKGVNDPMKHSKALINAPCLATNLLDVFAKIVIDGPEMVVKSK